MPQKRLLIGDAARRVGVHPATIRNWHRRGLIDPQRDVNGDRVFGRGDLVRLRELAGIGARRGE